jgi:uncharacterized membrane protein
MSTTVRALNPIDAALDAVNYASSLDMQQKHLAIAQIEATRAQTAVLEQLVYEQRTANLIAADRLDTILSPHGIGGEEYNAFWAKHAGNITQRLGMEA